MKNYFKYFAVLAIGIVACEPELDNPIEEGNVYTSGEANFSNYVAVGNSLTSGFADGALYLQGQRNSYPAIMADQFELAGGGEFTQPLVNDNAGGLLLNGTQITDNRFVLAVDANGNPGPAIYTGEAPTTEVSNILSGSFNNMGVPGAKSFHLGLSGYGNIAGVATRTSNPYFVRFASSSDATIIGDAVAQQPTFFSLWIGNNDVLSFATSGGAGADQTGNLDPSTYGSNDITDPNVFASVYSGYVDALVSTGAKGVLVNIPDVTSIPFFTTVPVRPIPLDAQTAAFVNGSQQVMDYNNAIRLFASFDLISQQEADRRILEFQAGQNGALLVDEDLTDLINPANGQPIPKLRQSASGDLLTLTSSRVLGTLANPGNPTSIIGVAIPLGDQFVLTPEEQTAVAMATTSYNTTIQGLAQANGLAFVDARAALLQVANGGVAFDGGTLTSVFATGGAFSLDGVHPTPRGYALTANAIITAINDTYNSTVPTVNIGAFSTINVSNNVGN